MNKLFFKLMCVAAAACASAATQYTWINGATDWEAESSYAEAGKPITGDIVYFPANTTAGLMMPQSRSFQLLAA